MRAAMKWMMVGVAVALAFGGAFLLQPVTTAQELMTVDPDDLFTEYSDDEDSFVLFPGTTDMQVGNSPHGALVTILINDVAVNSINAGNDIFDYGSHIIKKNCTSDGELAVYTNMVKIEGFDPTRGDWYWVQYDADGTVSTTVDGTTLAGAVDTCIDCHSAVSDTDWVFTPF